MHRSLQLPACTSSNERSLLSMTTTFPLQPPREQQDTGPASYARPASSFPDLSTLSSLLMPLHEVKRAWAVFSQDELSTSALMAASTALVGLYWGEHAL